MSAACESLGCMTYTPFPVFHTCVEAVTQLSPHIIRITLAGPQLRNYAAHGLDQRMKIVLELPEGGYGDFGILDDPPPGLNQWYAKWRMLPADQRNTIRTFTTSGIRPAQEEIDIDFVVHNPGGPASQWAQQAIPGDRLLVVGPDSRAEDSTGGIDFRPGAAKRILLVGDETAFPAIRNILTKSQPETQYHVFLASEMVQDAQTVQQTGPNQYMHRVTPADGQLAVDIHEWALAQQPATPGFYAWIAGESGVVKQLRRLLVNDHHVPREAITFSGYWKRGRAEH